LIANMTNKLEIYDLNKSKFTGVNLKDIKEGNCILPIKGTNKLVVTDRIGGYINFLNQSK